MTVLKLSFISLDLVEKLVSLEYDAELKRQLKIEYACLWCSGKKYNIILICLMAKNVKQDFKIGS